MEEQVIKKLIELDQRVEGMAIPEKPIDLISPFLALPGLRGFWPMSAFDSSGNAQDQSGHSHTLTYNGDPTYNYDGLVPYFDMDGTGDFLNTGDAADFDILGTESYVADVAKGLTILGWFYATATTTSMACITKGTAATPAYHLRIRGDSADEIQFIIVNGAAATGVTGSAGEGTTSTDDTWMFLAGRFDPSTELAVWRDWNKTTNVAAIPASIDNVAGDFCIGSFSGGAQYFFGRASICGLYVVALSDVQISSLFQTTRAAFGI